MGAVRLCLVLSMVVCGTGWGGILRTQGTWSTLEGQLQAEQQLLRGVWTESKQWNDWPCDAYYAYEMTFRGLLDSIRFELTEQGYVLATAKLRQIHVGANADARHGKTCIPVSGWLGVGVQWAELKSQVHFGQSESLKDMRLRILSVRTGQLELGSFVPNAFEDFFTGVVQRALAGVWNTRLGAWLSQKLTEQVRRRIPEDAERF